MSVEQHDATYTQADLERIVGMVLDQARSLGASQAEAGVSIESGLSLAVRLGQVETLEYQRDRGIGVTLYFGKRKGTASSSDLSDDAIREIVDSAASIARHTAEDDCAGLAHADMMARDAPDLDLCHRWNLEPQQAIDLALDCEDAARAADSRITNSEGANVTSHHGMRVYANSHGFIGGYESTGHSISCTVLASEDGRMQRDHWYTTARDPEDMEGPESVGRSAAARTIARLGARQISTCKASVLFTPEVARGLIGHFLSAIRGSNQYRQSSFLLNALGEQIFPRFVRIYERPHLPKALGSAAFDYEGVATRDRDLVADGVLRSYLLNSYSACKLGMETTGHAGGVHNLLIEPGEMDYQALLEFMGTGLVVTELMGQGVNGVTGDYSRGAAGFWVEGGKIAYPVEEITIAGNLRDIYCGILAVGRDVDLRGNIRTGSILVSEMTIAGG